MTNTTKTKATETKREIYIPTRGYELALPAGCAVVSRWEIVGRRVYVEYKDGLAAHSELTPGELRTMANEGKVARP